VTDVVYARVPISLKQALQAHAAERGLTLTGSVVELLSQALETGVHSHQLAALEQSLTHLREQLHETETLLREEELKLAAANQRQQTTIHIYRALAERLCQQLATCPRCAHPVSGGDLLIRGRCPNPECSTALTTLLAPGPQAQVDSYEYLALLGALGILAGLAQANSAETTT
jgi:hypothetical protein